jgi:muramidase (phage lysozyme)
MATLAELIRKQRSSGSSRSGALFSSVGMKVLESVDPRRMLNRSGVLPSLFPILKSYKAGGTSEKKVGDVSSSLTSSSTPLLQEMVVKLDSLASISNITARNSQALPGMSRDMNIMRQNIIKLVKLQGGKASSRADAFFSRAFERERLTESQMQASRMRPGSSQISPSPASKDTSIPGLGLLFGLVGALKTFGGKLIESIGSLTSVLAPLLKGGLSLIFDVAGSFAKLAVGGGASLLSFAGKKLGSLLRGVAGFLLKPAVLGALSVGGVAWLLNYLYSHEKTNRDGSVEGVIPELTQTAPRNTTGLPQVLDNRASGITPTPAPGGQEPASYEELLKAREGLRKSNPAAAARLDAISPLPNTKSPTPVPKKSVTPGADGELLDFIAAKESRGDYNAVYGQGSVPGLTNMTIAQVLEYQKRLVAMGQKSSAVGRYQFIRSTLEEEAKKAGLDINKELFTPQIQDKLILNRLRRVRGLDKFKSGQIDATQFAENLSMEFAALPSPKKGGGTKSYYEGIAGNKALTSMESVYAAIAPKTTGTQLSSSTSEFTSSQQQLTSQPMVISAPTNNVSQTSNGGSSGKPASAYDKEISQALLGLIS